MKVLVNSSITLKNMLPNTLWQDFSAAILSLPLIQVGCQLLGREEKEH